MFEPGQLCEDSLHLTGKEIAFLIISRTLNLGLKQIFKVVGAVDGAVKDVRLKKSIGGSCAPDQKFLIV
jgi:hypothetical protein